MLSHSSPLRLARHLQCVEPLPFDCISSEDCELMQLKTVSESSPHPQMPSFSHLTIYSSPPVTLAHLVANAIPLGLWVTGQEVPQKQDCLGNSLVVSLLGILEHLLGMRDLYPAGLLVILGGRTLGPSWLLEIL